MGLIIVGLITKIFYRINHKTEDFVLQEWTHGSDQTRNTPPPKKKI